MSRQILTPSVRLRAKRLGTSYHVLVPAQWKCLPELRLLSQMMFDAHVERDENGHVCLVFEKVPDTMRGSNDRAYYERAN